MNLSELKTGESGIIVKVNGSGAFRKRILEMGFIKGKTVKVILDAPLKDPIKYKIMDYEVSLRRSESQLIDVVYQEEYELQENHTQQKFDAILDNNAEDQRTTSPIQYSNKKKITVALVGNPNAGKTSLFNIASGAREHVGNYGGVTVDSKEGKFKHGEYEFKIIDLPGTYSISAYTPEELFVRQFLTEERPDIVINVVAASNLERNLYLTTELIDLGVPMVISLNMYDELTRSGSSFDHHKFSTLIGVPLIPTICKSGVGISDLFDTVIRVYEQRESLVKKIKIYYGNQTENAISKLNILLQKEKNAKSIYPIRYISIKLLEKDKHINEYVESNYSNAKYILPAAQKEIDILEKSLHEDTESIITNARYGFIAGGLKETFKEKHNESEITRVLDEILTNKYFGFPLFFFFMWVMFECTFRFGSYPMDWIESGVALLSDFVRAQMPEGMLKDLLVDGIIGGVGGVIIFLPNIVILYAFISFMEDSGYMARAAFIMDKVMHKMGLHGKSFIPLIMGFGCNVPAIMSTRTIESRNSRMITMLVTPFMSCSARLPVYLLFAGIFFKDYAGAVQFGLYITGIILAVVSARLFRRFLFKGEDTPFVMELPPYRVPTVKAVLRHMWDKSNQYLKKMGGLILIASIVIWFLGYFPQNKQLDKQFDAQIAQIEQTAKVQNLDDSQVKTQVLELEEKRNITHMENSYIGHIGKVVEPVVKPLGFDWKVGVSLLSGMAAKEVIVSTLGVLYTGIQDQGEESPTLRSRLASATNADGSKVFTSLSVISLLLFVLIYFPCFAAIAAIQGESGSWKWGAFTMLYTTGLAWLISFSVYQIGSLILTYIS